MAEYIPFGTVTENLDHRTLHQNKDWIEASARLYHANHGVLPKMEDVESYSGDTLAQKLADYGLMQMAGFNYNIVDQGIDTYTITQKADQRTKEAFVYMMDQYDNVDSSWHTAKQAGWEMATDFTNWVGLGTLGTAAFAGASAKFAGKQAVKKALMAKVKKEAPTPPNLMGSVKRAGMIAGAEGAAHGAAYDTLKQSVRLDAGAQEEFSYKSLALNTGIGFGAGAVFGTGIDFGMSKLGARKAQKQFDAHVKDLDEKAKAILKEAQAQEGKAPVKTKDSTDGTPVKNEDVIPQERTIENPEGKPLRVERQNFILVEGAGKDLVAKNVRIDERALSNDIAENGYEAIDRLLEELDNLELSSENWLKLKTDSNTVNRIFQDEDNLLTAQLMREDLTPEETSNLFAAWERNQANLRIMDAAAQHLNSGSGAQLQVSKLRYKLNKGIDFDDGSEAAEKEIMKAKRDVLRDTRRKTENDYNRKIQKLFDEDTPDSVQKALDLNMEKHQKLTELDAQIEQNFTDYDKFNKFMDKYVEMAISGVFSPATVIINTVWPTLKTYTYPMMDFMLRSPLSREKFSRTIQVYSQMFAATAAARNSAVNAFNLNQTTLTADFSRFMDGGIKVKGRAADIARVFPRLLGATDAYVQEVAAAGYLAGDAFDGLISEGVQRGLKGKKLKKYIDNNIEARIREGYDDNITANKLKPIYEKGIALGKKGEALDKYVQTTVNKMGRDGLKTLGNTRKVDELRKEADAIIRKGDKEAAKIIKEGGSKKAAQAVRDNAKKEAKLKNEHADRLVKTNEASLEYVQTLLYKKEFRKGQKGVAGAVESGAKWLEEAHRKHPIMKLFGNLFFRTPAWVFQESLRLTPAINMILPTFRRDLAGVNGFQAQARAQTELAVGTFLMMFVTTKWAQGEIKGSANKDFTKVGEQEVSGIGALQIELGDEGKAFDYRRWEPFRIPMTIWINALDGYMAQRDAINRQEAEDTIDDNTKKAFGIAMATMISAFKDSGLFTGIVDTIKAGVRTTGTLSSDDPDSGEKALNILGDTAVKKLLMPIPSSIKKGQVIAGGGEMIAPVNAQQRFLASFVPQAQSIPRKYDIFGNVRKVDNPWSAFNPFYYTTPEQRRAGRSDQEMQINDWIDTLEQQGYGNFTRSLYKSSQLPDVDLREVNTRSKDGREVSVYDAMMIELNSTGRKRNLINALMQQVKSPLSLGSPFDKRYNGQPVSEASRLISEAKREALAAIIARDPRLVDYQRQVQIKQGRNISGFTAPPPKFKE
tara:strand:- start:1330 stop:5139 length:3810 start_codon:yes stop_codon:yes gene_type:complete